MSYETTSSYVVCWMNSSVCLCVRLSFPTWLVPSFSLSLVHRRISASTSPWGTNSVRESVCVVTSLSFAPSLVFLRYLGKRLARSAWYSTIFFWLCIPSNLAQWASLAYNRLREREENIVGLLLEYQTLQYTTTTTSTSPLWFLYHAQLLRRRTSKSHG